MTARYCTYFDSGYLARGLTLIESLRRSGDTGEVTVLALDEATEHYFAVEPQAGVRVLSLSELEAFDPRLAHVKPGRSRAEYIFTLTPHLIRWVTTQADAGDVVAYLDADMAFFAPGTRVADALETDSVGIIPHRYPDALVAKLAKYGTYNVGWLGFRNDPAGRAVLEWYGDATIDWCADTPEPGRYADQGYLDHFDRFPGVRVLHSAGFNLAPWNAARHELGLELDGTLVVDGEELVFFHFHGLKKWGRRYVSAHSLYRSRLSPLMRDRVYRPYLERLEWWSAVVASIIPPAPVAKRGTGLRGIAFRVLKQLQAVLSLVQGNTIPVPSGARER